MGAISKLDLGAEVTHLIVGGVDTQKYKYVAKDRPDIKVLLPDWIHAVREKWVSGSDDLDLSILEEQHRAPVFYNLRICVTGFENLAQRKHIEELTRLNGADYRGDLSKEVTHLIAYSIHSEKYAFAKRCGLKIVAFEWFQQSLERGMTLDESLYDPLIPRLERGKGAWERTLPKATVLGKRQRGGGSSLIAAAVQNRRLRRSASSRFDSQNDTLWDNIVTAVPQAVQANTISEWDDEGGSDAIGHEVRRPAVAANITNLPNNGPETSRTTTGIFSEIRFVLYGFDKKKVSWHELSVQTTLTSDRQPYFKGISTPTMVLFLPQ